MTRYRKQKVVLRSKIRERRRSQLKSFALKSIRWALFLFLMGFGGKSFYDLLFRSNYFMIKSIEVEINENKTKLKILDEVSFLKGKTLFKLSKNSVETKLNKKFPEISSVKIRRVFPNGVKIYAQMRTPLATVRDGNFGIDEEGQVFPLTPNPEQGSASLPQLTYISTVSLPAALAFVKKWSGDPAERSAAFSSSTLFSVNADENGEITLVMNDPESHREGTKVFWGKFDSGTYSEKLLGLREVWSDLKKKSLSADYINLRQMPQKTESVLSDRKMVGRVIVRPAAMKKPRT